MKTIIPLLLLFVLVSAFAACAQTPDSTKIKLGDWYLGQPKLLFGTQIGASSDQRTQLQAQPFIGGGISFDLRKDSQWGFTVSGLFYTDTEKSIYPLVAAGLILFKDVNLALGWDFGTIKGTFEDSWKERMKVLVSYNLTPED